MVPFGESPLACIGDPCENGQLRQANRGRFSCYSQFRPPISLPLTLGDGFTQTTAAGVDDLVRTGLNQESIQ